MNDNTLTPISPTSGGCFWGPAEGISASVAWPVHASSCQGAICCDFIFRSIHIFPQRLKYLLLFLLLLQRVFSNTDWASWGPGTRSPCIKSCPHGPRCRWWVPPTRAIRASCQMSASPQLFLNPWTNSGSKWFIEIIQVEDLAKFSKIKCCLIEHLYLPRASEVTLS